MIIARHVKNVSLALFSLSSIAGLQSAFAIGTDAGVTINNRATVNYSVGSVAQTLIESSPTGNSTPGATLGTNTAFLVDNMIRHVVAEVSGNATIASPGQLNVVTAFTVTNTGNRTQDYQLTPTNLVGGVLFGQTDNTQVVNLRAFRDAGIIGTYEPGIDTATYIDNLAEDGNVTVWVVADIPITTTNGQYANVQLAAGAAVDGTGGATLEPDHSGALDNPAVVQNVFAEGLVPRNGIHEAADQYAIQSAALTVTKTSLVISDPFNLLVNPKAIPGAVVRYTVTVANGSTTTAAGSVVLDDLIPTNTVYLPASMTLNAAALTDAADPDAGTFATGPDRVVVTVGTIAASGTATVTFSVTIQ